MYLFDPEFLFHYVPLTIKCEQVFKKILSIKCNKIYLGLLCRGETYFTVELPDKGTERPACLFMLLWVFLQQSPSWLLSGSVQAHSYSYPAVKDL